MVKQFVQKMQRTCLIGFKAVMVAVLSPYFSASLG